MTSRLRLKLLDGAYAVARLDPGDPIPPWATSGGLWSVTRTGDELSIVCERSAVPAGTRAQSPWRCFQLEGPLDFSETGILSALSGALAAAGISLFALSTFDTDYVLVDASDVDAATRALEAAGCSIE